MSQLGEVWERERPGGRTERIELCGQLAAGCGTPLWRYRDLGDPSRRGLIAAADLAVGWRRRAGGGAAKDARRAT